MEAIYTKDKNEFVGMRMNSELLGRIENFKKTQGIWSTSEAIRVLIELGLSASTSSLLNSSSMSKGQVIETEIIERTEKITRQRIMVLENIKSFFPKKLKSVLTFECAERNAIIRKRFYLPKEEWRKITNIVKKHDGEWISDGNKSRWIIPLT